MQGDNKMEYNPRIKKACPHPYYWRAQFTDGGVISQYTDNGEEVLYREVLRRLKAGKGLLFIEWHPTSKDFPLFHQEIDSSWQRPVLFRRHFKPMDKRPETVLFCIGWQATINGKNYKSITYLDVKANQVLITHRDW